MKIENIKQGDKFYNADKFNFSWYTYLMPYPLKPSEKGVLDDYHIIINRKSEQPERWYGQRLQELLDKNLTSLEDVRKYQIKLTKKYLFDLKNKE